MMTGKVARFAVLILAVAAFAAVFSAGARGTEAGTPVMSTLLFGYDKSQHLEASLVKLDESPQRIRYKVEYDTTNGQRVHGYFYLPPHGKAPYPVVIFMHGAGGSKDDFITIYEFYVMRGYAALVIDAAFHGDRTVPGVNVFKTDWYQYRNVILQSVVDLQRGVDWLETRPEIDTSRIGFVGISQGSFVGTIFCGIEKRVKAVILLMGGADFPVFFRNSQVPSILTLRNFGNEALLDSVANQLAMVDPMYYVGAISPRPLLMVNGRSDRIISTQAATRLHELAGEPKEIYWYDGGHVPPFDRALMMGLKFFKKNLLNSDKKTASPAAAAVPAVSGTATLTVVSDVVLATGIKQDFTDPNRRLVTLTASAAKPLPAGARLMVRLPVLGPDKYPLYDDGSHGDAKSGDGTWTMQFVFGPHMPRSEFLLVGTPETYNTEVVAVGADGRELATKEAGVLLFEDMK